MPRPTSRVKAAGLTGRALALALARLASGLAPAPGVSADAGPASNAPGRSAAKGSKADATLASEG